MKNNMTYFVLVVLCGLFVAPFASAQDGQAQENVAEQPEKKFVEWTIKKSLFMTPNEITSVLQARQGYLAPEEAYDEDNQYNPVDPGPRILSLAGIVYVNRNDWTIWLNGERVTPANVPDRVIDLTVKRDRIHMKWLDIKEQRVVVITLRSHQRYDLDSGLMMPGT